MIDFSLAEIAEIVGGELHDVPDPQARVTGFVEFDSRKVTPGGLFLALPGARVDGHDFAETAIAAGAVAVLAARPLGVPAIVVKPQGRTDSNADIYAHDEDGSAAAVVGALSALARAVVTRLEAEDELIVVGITGSAGKTSTKDLVASVLRGSGDTVAPPGSFNNEIGHPYTALRCDTDTRFLVAEMSARGIGHIRQLAEIAPPQIGAVLNVGSAHLGEFGSRENIAQAKGELVEALPVDGTAILNADDPFVAAMADRTEAQVVFYSAAQPPAPGADLWAEDIELDDVARPSFTLRTPTDSVRISLQVFGEHQVSNALAAAAVGLAVGLSLEQIAEGLSHHKNASAHRMDVQTRGDGVTVINDSYNANPDSMKAGIAALAYTAAARPNARAVAVLGEMGELGPDAEQSHRELGEELDRYRITHLIAVGSSANSRAMATEAENRGITTSVAQTIDEAITLVDTVLRTRPSDYSGPGGTNPGDVVLVKASNSQGLWRVAEGLLHRSASNEKTYETDK